MKRAAEIRSGLKEEEVKLIDRFEQILISYQDPEKGNPDLQIKVEEALKQIRNPHFLARLKSKEFKDENSRRLNRERELKILEKEQEEEVKRREVDYLIYFPKGGKRGATGDEEVKSRHPAGKIPLKELRGKPRKSNATGKP